MSTNIFYSRLQLARTTKLKLQCFKGLQSQRFYTKKNLLSDTKVLAICCTNCLQIRHGSNISTDPIKTEYVNQVADSFERVTNIFSDSPLTQGVEDILISFHDASSLEWSSTIFLSALFLRIAICFPFRIYQERIQAKGIILQTIVKDAVEKKLKQKDNKLNQKDFQIRFTPEMQRKISQETEKQVKDLREKIYKDNDFKPFLVPIASVIQFPFWMTFSTSFRDFSFGANSHYLQLEQFSTESVLWLNILASPDPYFILPLLYCISAGTVYQYRLLDSHSVIAKATGAGKSLTQRITMTIIFCFLIVFALLIAKSPAALGIFWISSNSLHLLECIILDSVKFRRLVGIPKHNFEPSNIYKFKYAVVLNGIKRILKSLKR